MPTGIYERTRYHSKRLSESHLGVSHSDKMPSELRAERQRQSRIRWNKAHPEKLKSAGSKWTRLHADRANAKTARRTARKLRAMPIWLSEEQRLQILEFYSRAKQLNLVVDHIIPLRGKNVSGLHVPWNLQLLTRDENSRKGNKVCHLST